MNRFLHLLWLAIAPSFLVFAESDFGFDWTSDDYEIIFADFDGDGNLDSLLLSNKSDLPSWFLNGVTGSSPTSHWQSFDKESEYLAPGDFDNDGKAELLVMQKDLSGRYLELNQDSELVEGEEKLKFSGYNKNRQIDFTHLIKGDFNGDNSDDLLAYAESNHDIVVFHNQQKSKKIKLKFDAQLTLENTSPLTPFTNDFNGDGLVDIALISSEVSGQSYVAFAGKKGRFKKSDFQDITPYLNGEEFNTNQHTIQMLKSADSESQIVRLTNAQLNRTSTLRLVKSRTYGDDGYPLTDRDIPHPDEKGCGNSDHCHDWDRPKDGGPPKHTNRGPSRPPKPGDPPKPRGPNTPIPSKIER